MGALFSSGAEVPWNDTQEMRDCLRDEYQILAGLRHPHIVQALGFVGEGEAEEGKGRPLLVLQLHPGPLLAELISAREPLREEVICKIITTRINKTRQL